jgi:hypothetical protein
MIVNRLGKVAVATIAIGLAIGVAIVSSLIWLPIGEDETESAASEAIQEPQNYYEVSVRHWPDQFYTEVSVTAVGNKALLFAVGLAGAEEATCIELLPEPHGYGVSWKGTAKIGVNTKAVRLAPYAKVEARDIAILRSCSSRPFSLELIAYEQVSPMYSKAKLEYLGE